MFRGMKVLIPLALVAALACRPSDGGSQNTPPATPASPSPAPAPAGAGATSQAASEADRQNAMLERADAGRIKGVSGAPVWIVEVSDFQCPFCRRFTQETYPIIDRDYVQRGLVRIAYVNLPLSIHPNAQPAAETAMCASEQGRFWPVHDALFAAQDRWASLPSPAAFFDSLARAAGVDEPRYRACMDSQVMRRLIGADVDRAASRGIRSTPYFFVGNERIEGAAPIAEFRAAIARAAAAQQGAGRTP